MELRRQIMGYCERLDGSFWAEPLNAASNAAFLIAAFYALAVARREGRLDLPVGFLVLTTTAVGVGSFLFHTFATVWAAIADTTPIMIFILGYFGVAMNRYVGLPWWQAALATGGFFVALGAMSAGLRPLLYGVIGGSVSYVPAFLGLVAVGAWLGLRSHPAAAWLFAAAGLFAVSLTFRAIDRQICDVWPYGTHFLWHLLNGTVLGVLLLGLIRHGRPPEAARRPAVA